MKDIPLEINCAVDPDVVRELSEGTKYRDEFGEFLLTKFTDNDCSLTDIEGFIRQLPLCYTGPATPLRQLYDEAEGLTTFREVIQEATERYAVGNVQQRALVAASVPGTRRLNYDIIRQNNDDFSRDPLQFITSMNATAAPRRLSTKRILEAYPYANEFPEWDRLCGIAAGVMPPIEASFVPSVVAAKVRSSMRQIQPALDVLANVLVERQEGFIVSLAVFKQACAQHGIAAHLSELHHIAKVDSDFGRLLFDYSNLEGATPINHPSLKPQLKEQFGELKMPTLASLYVKVEELEQTFPNVLMNLRKSDVARAFQRMNWSPEASMLMALLLSDEYVLVPTSCGFGSSVGPYGYGPITRFFEFMHKRIVSGLLITNPVTEVLVDSLGIIYVDDALDVGPEALLE